MTRLVVFVEEASARIVVEAVLARAIPDVPIQVAEHEGRSDLESSFPRKIRAWRYPTDVPFMVLRDNDGADCFDLKRRLLSKVPSDRINRTRVRIVMQCLECWYLGDFGAMVASGLIDTKRGEQLRNKAKFRRPDAISNAKHEFLQLHDVRGQLLIARQIGPHLDLDQNKSDSFRLFVSTARALVGPPDVARSA